MKMSKNNEEPYTSNNSILCYSFNQNASCFCVGTEKGFTIYKSFPLNDYYIRELEGGVGLIAMFNNSNIIGLVGGGKRPFASLNKLIIWNDATSKVVCEIIIDTKIRNVKIKESFIAIISKKQIKIYYYDSLKNIINYKNIDTINTLENPNGIFGLNLEPKITIISYLSNNVGEIIIKNYGKTKNIKNSEKIKSTTKTISAHQSEITNMSLNYKGDLLASCSEKGTIIRIYSTEDGDLLKELRRGTDYAEIYSLNFDLSSQFLICSSSKGTVHIFNIKENNSGIKNQKSFLSSIGSYLKIQNDYLKNEWSFSQFHIDAKCKHIVNFINYKDNNLFVVLTENGIYYRASFDLFKGGECTIKQKKDYFNTDSDDFDFQN
jgi:WD40 repeat protein